MNAAALRPAQRERRTATARAVSSAELFAAYQARIHGYVLSKMGDPTEADDLTQEVFLRAHRSLASLRDPDAALPWLYRIATNICYDRFRQQARQPRLDPRDVSDVGDAVAATASDASEDASADLVVERSETSAWVRDFLKELSDDYRQVIVLHDLQDLTNPEIAEMLGVSVNAIKIRLHRARRKLEVLAANGDSPQPGGNHSATRHAP